MKLEKERHQKIQDNTDPTEQETIVKKEIIKLKDKEAVKTNNRDMILEIVEKFNAELYTTKYACDLDDDRRKRRVVNINSGEILAINPKQIQEILQQMKNGEAVGEDGGLAEMLKMAETTNVS